MGHLKQIKNIEAETLDQMLYEVRLLVFYGATSYKTYCGTEEKSS